MKRTAVTSHRQALILRNPPRPRTQVAKKGSARLASERDRRGERDPYMRKQQQEEEEEKPMRWDVGGAVVEGLPWS